VAEREESPFLATWYELPQASVSTELDASYWELIAKSLSASVTLYCNDALKTQLDKLADELRFVLITSNAVVEAGDAPEDAIATDLEGLSVVVAANTDEKCARCWHQRPDVGSDEKHPELCGRCIENIEGDGEVRHFA